jgi:hypothetical protein
MFEDIWQNLSVKNSGFIKLIIIIINIIIIIIITIFLNGIGLLTCSGIKL